MVRCVYWALIMASPTILCTEVRASPAVRSARVVSTSPLHIKPYQPAFISLEVVMDGWTGEKLPVLTPEQVEQEVVINGESYPRFNSNPVALFELDRDTIERISRETIRFRVVTMLFFNARDRDYIFGKPGKYNIQFCGGASVSVIVEAPTPVEEAFIQEIEHEEREFVAVVLEGGSRPTMAMLPRLEAILKKYRETAYAETLSILVGENKLRGVVEEYRSRDSSDMAGLARERVAVMREYLEPYSHSISSPNQAKAVYMLAQGLLDQVKHDADTVADAGTRKEQATELLKRVAESPFSFQQRGEAKSKLEELKAAQVVPARP